MGPLHQLVKGYWLFILYALKIDYTNLQVLSSVLAFCALFSGGDCAAGEWFSSSEFMLSIDSSVVSRQVKRYVNWFVGCQ